MSVTSRKPSSSVTYDGVTARYLIAICEDILGCGEYAQRDIRYIIKRYSSEGLPFLAVTLPKLCTCLEDALESGKLHIASDFVVNRDTKLPILFHHLFERIFTNDGDPKTRTDACTKSVASLRQLCRQFKKIEAAYSEEACERAKTSLQATQESLFEEQEGGWNDAQRELLSRASGVIHSIFNSYDPTSIIPRPGPGATACGTEYHDRFKPGVIFEDIHKAYNPYNSYFAGIEHYDDRFSAFESLPREASGVARLSVVSKYYEKPRLICMMPHEYMWHQQGLADVMKRAISEHANAHHSMHFEDQTFNQRAAFEGSIDGSVATIDMSSASDRISRVLVRECFRHLPNWQACLFALSPRYLDMSGKGAKGSFIEPRMFAPMGSSLCFPTMTVVHYALILACVSLDHDVDHSTISRKILVYGDDITCPVEWVRSIKRCFSQFRLIINRDKTFSKGLFRESCGLDAYKGFVVTPVYVRSRACLDPIDTKDLISSIDLEYALRCKRYTRAAASIRSNVERRLGYLLPYVGINTPYIGWRTWDNDEISASFPEKEWSRRYQCEVVSVGIIRRKTYDAKIDDWERLLYHRVLATGRAPRKLDKSDVVKITTKDRVPITNIMNSNNVLPEYIMSTWLYEP